MASRQKGIATRARALVAKTPSSNTHVRQDFTYKKATGLDFDHANFRQSLFIGAILESCQFTSCNFDRCDFSGTKLVGCVFEDCTFIPDEIRSCIFYRCTFRRCDFRGSQWQRIEIERSHFHDCDLRETSFRECIFSNTELALCPLKRSSVTLCRFEKCNFHKIYLGDCTALYLFFDDCSFDECRVNAETLGFTYGLSGLDIDNMDLIYLGRRQAKPKTADFVETLIANYWHRKWYIGGCVLELNFRRAMPVIAIRRLINALDQLINENLPFDWDELRFFIDVLDRLQSENRLPLLGLWGFLQTIHRIHSGIDGRHPKAGAAIGAQLVMSRASEMLLNALDLLITTSNIPLSSNPLWLDLKLSRRPTIPIADLIPPNVYRSFGSERIVFISGQEGSWGEVWQVSIGSLVALQLSLAAVNGVLRQCAKLTDNLRRLMKPRRAERSPPRQGSRLSKRRGHRDLVKHSLGSVSDILSTDMEVTLLRLESLPLKMLLRIESAMKMLNRLDDGELAAFREYDGDQLQSVRVRKAKARAKDGRQAHPPAA